MGKRNYYKLAILSLISLIVLGDSALATSKSFMFRQKTENDSVPDLQNGLAHTPPMGWNSWNHFRCDINENIIVETANAMVSSGMKNAGYEYIVIDDCWMADHRNSKGQLTADPDRFPHGIKWLVNYVHSKGLKFGIYEDAGTQTCAGLPGSLGHEKEDAKTFASWGVDFLKYDGCFNQGISYTKLYVRMAKALLLTGRPIVYSITVGIKKAGKISNMWRTSSDIRANWKSMMDHVDNEIDLYSNAGPGHWNNPDMLQIGNKGIYKGDTGLTLTEDKTQFSLWAMLAAPLIAGNDLRHMDPRIKGILTNKAVIAIDQDAAGIEGHKAVDYGAEEVWVKPLSDGSVAVALLNRGLKQQLITATAKQVRLPKSDFYKETNLWTHKSKRIKDRIRALVPPHGIAMFRIWPESI